MPYNFFLLFLYSLSATNVSWHWCFPHHVVCRNSTKNEACHDQSNRIWKPWKEDIYSTNSASLSTETTQRKQASDSQQTITTSSTIISSCSFCLNGALSVMPLLGAVSELLTAPPPALIDILVIWFVFLGNKTSQTWKEVEAHVSGRDSDSD